MCRLKSSERDLRSDDDDTANGIHSNRLVSASFYCQVITASASLPIRPPIAFDSHLSAIRAKAKLNTKSPFHVSSRSQSLDSFFFVNYRLMIVKNFINAIKVFVGLFYSIVRSAKRKNMKNWFPLKTARIISRSSRNQSLRGLRARWEGGHHLAPFAPNTQKTEQKNSI